MPDLLYKATGRNGACVYGRGSWQLDKWRTATPPLQVCARGIHYCRRNDVVGWLNAELWLFEDGAPDTALDGGDKMVTTKGRIVERVEAWNDTTARLFAADCAEAVLPIFYKELPDDDRPQKAIDAARAYARGEIPAAARAAAGAAAGAAARAAAGDAAGDAARDAAGAAARGAAGAAAGAAARDAAWAAARAAAGAAAGDAARDAAGDAARDAAWAAAGAAAGVSQTALLFDYLEGRKVA